MSERSWPTMTAGGLCHLVVAETGDCPDDCRAELKSLLEVVASSGDWALDATGSQILVAFTSFADTERFTSALRDVRPVRQIDPRWASQWDGVYDGAALRRLRQELRWQQRASRGPAAAAAAP